MLAAGVTGWWLLHTSITFAGNPARHGAAFNPGYEHSQRLSVATARAAMDAVAMATHGADADQYAMDYSVQRRQIQADSEGLARWSKEDTRHQGLLREIHIRLAEFLAVLDRTVGNASAASAAKATNPPPLLTSLARVQQSLSNYSANLTEPANLPSANEVFSGPVELWWIALLLWIELAALAWLVFPAP